MKKLFFLSLVAIALLASSCEPKEPKNENTITTPNSPTTLKVKDTTKNSVTLSWISDASTESITTDYTVEYSTSADFGSGVQKVTSKETTATVKDLEGNGQTYYFRVIANNSNAQKSSSPSSTVSQVVGTKPVTNQSAKPTLSNVILQKNANGEVMLSWQATAGKDANGMPVAVTKFLIKIATSQAALSTVTAVEVSVNSQTNYVIEANPASGATYWVNIQAITNNADTDYANSEVVEKSYTEPISNNQSAKPTLSNVTLQKSVNNQVVLSWQAAAGKNADGTSSPVTKFLIKKATTQAGLASATAVEINTNTQTSYVIEANPVAGTTYWANIQAVTNNADANYANSEVVEQSYTDQSAKPTLSNVMLQKSANNQVVLSWQATAGKNADGTSSSVTKFLIKKATTQAGLASATAVEINTSTQTSYVIEANPVAGTTYWANIQAVTDNADANYANSEVVEQSYTEQTTVIYPNAYKFEYNGHTYYIVNDPRTWENAAADALSNQGYLVHINTQAEQDTIVGAIKASGITFTQFSTDGGGARYLWMGATDAATEGTWVWNGDNTGSTEALGVSTYDDSETPPLSWTSASGAYQNWGTGSNFGQGPSTMQNEPDNFVSGPNDNVGQDYGAIALELWPQQQGLSEGEGLGDTYEWNDIKGSSTLPYIVEVE